MITFLLVLIGFAFLSTGLAVIAALIVSGSCTRKEEELLTKYMED